MQVHLILQYVNVGWTWNLLNTFYYIVLDIISLQEITDSSACTSRLYLSESILLAPRCNNLYIKVGLLTV